MDIGKMVDGFLGQMGGAAQGAAQGVGGLGRAGGLGGAAQAATGGLSNIVNQIPGGLAGGAAAGGLAALLLGNKKARKIGGKVLTYGGLAVVGGLAYKAWRDHKANANSAPAPMNALPAPPADSGFDIAGATDAGGGDMRLALIRAMIAAAKSDGHIDAEEQTAINGQISSSSLGADEKAFLFDQLNAPSDPIAIANLARDEAQAAELYLASALTIDIDTPQEQRYMQRLGDALRLPDDLRRRLDQHAEAAKAEAAGV